MDDRSMPGEITRDYEDDARYYPAARCRECGAVTYECNLVTGIRPATSPRHHKGCLRPLGRMDLISALSDARYDPRLETELYGRRLREYMTDGEVMEAAALLPELIEGSDNG